MTTIYCGIPLLCNRDGVVPGAAGASKEDNQATIDESTVWLHGRPEYNRSDLGRQTIGGEVIGTSLRALQSGRGSGLGNRAVFIDCS